MTVQDNAAELRKLRHPDTLVERIIHASADEITRLRDELFECKAAALHAESAMVEDIERQRGEINALCETMRIVNDSIERLRKERDEARRRLCLEWTEHGPVRLSKEQIAMRYGWDCFKENTND